MRGLQLSVLLWKVLGEKEEAFGGGAGGGRPMGQALGFDSLLPLPVHFLFPDCR